MDNRHRYNPEYNYNKALDLLETVSKEDAIVWYNCPCTQALLNSLEGDLAGVVLMLIGGAYLDDKSSSGTAQKVSKAIGMTSAINDVIEHIKEIKDLKVEGESVE